MPRGAASPVIYKTFSTADALTKSQVLAEDTIKEIVGAALQAAKDLSAARDQLEDSIRSEGNAASALASSRSASSTVIPVFFGVEALTNSFALRCDHAFRSLLHIAKILYPEWSGKAYFEGLRDHLLLRDKDKVFANYLTGQLSFIKSMRELRNCVEHPKPDRKVIVKSYHLKPTGDISAPTIEIIHPTFRQVEFGLSTYLKLTIPDICSVFEEMLAFMIDRRGSNFGRVKLRVCEVPEGQRRYGTVKYDLTIGNWPDMAP